jgi:hypothetical protein
MNKYNLSVVMNDPVRYISVNIIKFEKKNLLTSGWGERGPVITGPL